MFDASNIANGVAGGPGMPELSGTVRGEKEWQGWAQDHVDWGSKQENIANERPPYNSTLLMFDVANGTGSPAVPVLSGSVKGEKEW